MKIKFNNSDEFIEIQSAYFESNRLCLVGDNIPQLEDVGFIVYEDDGTTINMDCTKYTKVYESANESVFYVTEDDLYSTFLIVDNNDFVYSQVTMVNVDVSKIPNCYLYKSGYSKEYRFPEKLVLFDDDGVNLYKIVDDELVETTAEDKELIAENISTKKQKQEAIKLENAIQNKIDEINTVCEQNITYGIDYNGEHFSYAITDQNNIYNTMQLAKMTGFDTPYHADGESCKLYSFEDIMSIYSLQEMNLTQHITYANQLKLYVRSLSVIKDIENISYGDKLTGEYLDTYNSIMEHSQNIFTFVEQSNI